MGNRRKTIMKEKQPYVVSSNNVDSDSSDTESEYEPTSAEKAQIENDFYDSDSGESIDELDLETRKAIIEIPNTMFTSKDGKISFSENITSKVHQIIPDTNPGNISKDK